MQEPLSQQQIDLLLDASDKEFHDLIKKHPIGEKMAILLNANLYYLLFGLMLHSWVIYFYDIQPSIFSLNGILFVCFLIYMGFRHYWDVIYLLQKIATIRPEKLQRKVVSYFIIYLSVFPLSLYCGISVQFFINSLWIHYDTIQFYLWWIRKGPV